MVEALLGQVAQDALPPSAERKRLREAAGQSQAQIATALSVADGRCAHRPLGGTDGDGSLAKGRCTASAGWSWNAPPRPSPRLSMGPRPTLVRP
ncbi:hypothetical protein STRMOE7_02395 [Streptomyces sp. MOE7]|nr:hypothetical protein STRMOE7_02395 [Streptomyces sp. MOE7]